MDILQLVKETGFEPKRKAATYGGEYCSPCPFCGGDDRFFIQPSRSGWAGGKFSCRVCGRFGDAVKFLCEYHGISYLEACARLRIQPKWRSEEINTKTEPKPPKAEEPPDLWKEKATTFVDWAHVQLMNNPAALARIKQRGFTQEAIARFKLGYNPKTFFRNRTDWGLSHQLKEDGKARKLWLPAGIVIPTFTFEQVVKVKVRRSEWKEGDQWPKYVEISGSKQMPSIFGDVSLSFALVLESELDALLIQQFAADLVYCVALGGSTKPLDIATYHLLEKTQKILFLPDFDEAGAAAWVKWKKRFPNIQRILTPKEKSAGDYFLAGGDLRKWLQDNIAEIHSRINK